MSPRTMMANGVGIRSSVVRAARELRLSGH
jgi:hypothetical protein